MCGNRRRCHAVSARPDRRSHRPMPNRSRNLALSYCVHRPEPKALERSQILHDLCKGRCHHGRRCCRWSLRRPSQRRRGLPHFHQKGSARQMRRWRQTSFLRSLCQSLPSQFAIQWPQPRGCRAANAARLSAHPQAGPYRIGWRQSLASTYLSPRSDCGPRIAAAWRKNLVRCHLPVRQRFCKVLSQPRPWACRHPHLEQPVVTGVDL